MSDSNDPRGHRQSLTRSVEGAVPTSRRQWLIGAAAGGVGWIAHPASAEAQSAQGVPPSEPLPQLALQPLGEQLPDPQLQLVQTALRAFYVCDVQVLPRIALPKRAYYRPRSRYRAEVLLEELAARKPPSARFVLGMTGADISTTKGSTYDWGVLGLADIAGTACVISTFRTRRAAKSARHAAERFAKTAVHEIGHNLGLRHCPNFGCLMEDGKGTVLTTDHEYDLCPQCRQRLLSRGIELAEDATIPWPRP